jgi:hypothetical protein
MAWPLSFKIKNLTSATKEEILLEHLPTSFLDFATIPEYELNVGFFKDRTY